MSVETIDISAQRMPKVGFAPRRLGHTNMFVDDLDASMKFYNRVAGFEEVFRTKTGAGFLSNGNTHHDLGLVQTTAEPRLGRDGKPLPSSNRAMTAGLNHLGWELESEKLLIEAYDRAVDEGYPIHQCIDHHPTRSIYLFDPDGHMHEFYCDVLKDWRGWFASLDGSAFSGQWDPTAEAPSDERNYWESPEIQQVDGALIRARYITHAVLLTQDHDAMVGFFRNVGGLDVEYEAADGSFSALAGTHAGHHYSLALLRQPAGSDPVVHHYAYKIGEAADLDAAETAVAGAGIEIEKRVDTPAKRSFFIRDPDGFRCEFYVSGAVDFDAVAAAPETERPFLI